MTKKLSPEQIKLIADNLLPGFTPKNQEENEVSFNFTVEKNTYRVFYEKEKKAGQAAYVFRRYEEVKELDL